MPEKCLSTKRIFIELYKSILDMLVNTEYIITKNYFSEQNKSVLDRSVILYYKENILGQNMTEFSIRV